MSIVMATPAETEHAYVEVVHPVTSMPRPLPKPSVTSSNSIVSSTGKPKVPTRNHFKLNVVLILINVILSMLCGLFAALYVIEKTGSRSNLSAKSTTSEIKEALPNHHDENVTKSTLGSISCNCNKNIVESGIKCAGSWIRMDEGCVGTRNNQFKEITYKGSSRFIVAMKLVHKSGQVSCHGPALSNWGCNKIGPTYLNMIITDINNQTVYPSPRLVSLGVDGRRGWYKLPGYTALSSHLVFSDFGHPRYLKHGETLKIWYGEDLFDHTEVDNHGFTCMDIYAYFLVN